MRLLKMKRYEVVYEVVLAHFTFWFPFVMGGFLLGGIGFTWEFLQPSTIWFGLVVAFVMLISSAFFQKEYVNIKSYAEEEVASTWKETRFVNFVWRLKHNVAGCGVLEGVYRTLRGDDY
jgi:hypothetical protein